MVGMSDWVGGAGNPGRGKGVEAELGVGFFAGGRPWKRRVGGLKKRKGVGSSGRGRGSEIGARGGRRKGRASGV